jgi:hypothetical protein
VDRLVRPQVVLNRDTERSEERALRNFVAEAHALDSQKDGEDDQAMPVRSALSPFQWDRVIEAFKNHVTDDVKRPVRSLLPLRWSSTLLGRFDALPVLAYLHRSVSVDMTSMPPIQALRDAYADAANSLPEPLRPSRLIYDGGAHPSWGGVIVEALVTRPELTADFPGRGGIHDLYRRPDGSGATDCGQLMLAAALAAQQDGRTAAVIHRIDDDRAEIVLVSSPARAGQTNETIA